MPNTTAVVVGPCFSNDRDPIWQIPLYFNGFYYILINY